MYSPPLALAPLEQRYLTFAPVLRLLGNREDLAGPLLAGEAVLEVFNVGGIPATCDPPFLGNHHAANVFHWIRRDANFVALGAP